jgi:hypothetical protein
MMDLGASPRTPGITVVSGLVMIGLLLLYLVLLYTLVSHNFIAWLYEQVARGDLIPTFRMAAALLSFAVVLLLLPGIAILFMFWPGWLMNLIAVSFLTASLLRVGPESL